MKKLLLIEGSITEIKDGDGFMLMRERVMALESLLRDSLIVCGDGAWHKRVYEALGEDAPPLRKLKGKVPRYQKDAALAARIDV